MTRSLPMRSFASSWHLWSISESISHPWLPSELCMKRFVSPSVCSETTGCTRKQQVKKQRCASQIKCWKVSIWKACATWGCSICVYIDKHLSISNTKGYYPWTLYIHNIEVMFHIYFAYICMVIIYIYIIIILYIFIWGGITHLLSCMHPWILRNQCSWDPSGLLPYPLHARRRPQHQRKAEAGSFGFGIVILGSGGRQESQRGWVKHQGDTLQLNCRVQQVLHLEGGDT